MDKQKKPSIIKRVWPQWILVSAAGFVSLVAIGTVFAISSSLTSVHASLSRPVSTLPPSAPQQASTTLVNKAVKPKVDLLHGIASWYGSVLNGHHTASGEIFNMNALTAAHPTLPFGTRVLVTNLKNHESVVVRITDRGILSQGRIIDLSYGAAKQINMAAAGTAPVELEVLPPA